MPDPEAIARLLTPQRLSSYLSATNHDVDAAIGLYDWNSDVAAAFHADLGRFEVVLRNALDQALGDLGQRKGWSDPWYRQAQLFPGRQGRRALDDIATARRRVTARNRPEIHGKMIAEFTFGFWRYLTTSNYLTSLWIPALTSAFPGHPATSPRQIRADIETRVQRLHFVRNRIAHHEPIHKRNLTLDLDALTEVVSWIDHDCATWINQQSRTLTEISKRP